MPKDFLAQFEPGMFSMIFLDIYMKEMTGMDAAKSLHLTGGYYTDRLSHDQHGASARWLCGLRCGLSAKAIGGEPGYLRSGSRSLPAFGTG